MARVVIRGLMDGALSSLGVVIGASIARDPAVILSAGLSGAAANGLSNVLAAFTAEKTGDYEKLRALERRMLKSLKGTRVERSIRKRVVKAGAVDGLFSVIGGAFPVLPFLFLDVGWGVILSIALVSILSGVIGVYTSIVSRENLAFGAMKLILFTIATALICVGIQFLF